MRFNALAKHDKAKPCFSDGTELFVDGIEHVFQKSAEARFFGVGELSFAERHKLQKLPALGYVAADRLARTLEKFRSELAAARSFSIASSLSYTFCEFSSP